MKTRGRPPKRDDEKWSRTVVGFFERNLEYLNQTEARIRLSNGARLGISAILRAFVEAVEESGLDVSGCASEEEIKALVAASIKAPKPKKKTAEKGKKAAK